MSVSSTSSRRRRRAVVVVPTLGALALSVVSAAGGGASAAPAPAAPSNASRAVGDIVAEAPVYAVTREGFTADEAAELGRSLGIEVGLRKNGSFTYVDARQLGVVPQVPVEEGKDENGRPTLAQALDLDALKSLEVLPEERALALARKQAPLPSGFEATPRVSHTTVELGENGKGVVARFELDTSVSFDLALDGVPVVGPAARSRITYAADGRVIGLNAATRHVEKAGWVGIIGPDAAQQQCERLYGGAEKLDEPTLVYYSPPLTGQGEGRVKVLVPHYACTPVGDERDPVGYGRLVPAAPELTPDVTVAGTREGRKVAAAVKINGGTAPYKVAWTSSSNPFKRGGRSIEFTTRGRLPGAIQHLTATVTDANGLVSSATIALSRKGSSAEATGVGGQGGVFAEVGIEQTVDEWQCAQDSAIGFKAVMQNKGHAVNFDWRGNNAWESDFKRTSAGGHDNDWVDSVDAQWYTGHGSPNSFTFKNTTHDDDRITPSEARWGDNNDLEWMQLESCQVLRDTNGNGDYFQRWAPAFDGLHLLNGFHTNAQCVSGGTGRRFAEYLFPGWFWRPSLTVAQAWQSMANDLEPGGTVWRTVSPARAGWVTNLGDYFWGQGSVGPDIPLNQQIGWVSISGTV